MNAKVLNALVIISSLFGFLEWGQNNKMFLFQAEAEIVSKIFTNPTSVLHPFTILPLLGQILLLATIFQKSPSKVLTYIGIGGIGILLLLMFVIGCLSFNWKILSSTIPFFVLVFLTMRHYRKMKID
jgi:hypothetical protein